jgi:LPS-assembly lipoprotein
MRLLALLLPLLLTACGFQLRGANILPPGKNSIYLVASGNLREQVSIFLEGSDTRLVKDRGSADVVLTLANPRFNRRVLSVDPDTGKEREFELSYTLDMNAREAGGENLISPQSVTLLRDYVFDRTALIGAGQEESVLRREMMRDAVQQVLSRLRAATAG